MPAGVDGDSGSRVNDSGVNRFVNEKQVARDNDRPLPGATAAGRLADRAGAGDARGLPLYVLGASLASPPLPGSSPASG